jgi:acyl transferase domain-containing protein
MGVNGIAESSGGHTGARPLTKPASPDFRPQFEDSKRAIMTRTGQKTAFAFAGGGSLGAIQVGMLRVLLSAGVQPDFVVGASVGAMNAAYRRSPERGRGGEARGNLVRGLVLMAISQQFYFR